MSCPTPLRRCAIEIAEGMGEVQAADMISSYTREMGGPAHRHLLIQRERHMTEGTGVAVDIARMVNPGWTDDLQLTHEAKVAVTEAIAHLIRLRRRTHAIVDYAARTGRDARCDRAWATGMHEVMKSVLAARDWDMRETARPDPSLGTMDRAQYATACRLGLPSERKGFVIQGDRVRARVEIDDGLFFDDRNATCIVSMKQEIPDMILQAAPGMPLAEVIGHAGLKAVPDDIVVTGVTRMGATEISFEITDGVSMIELPPAAADMAWSRIGCFQPSLD